MTPIERLSIDQDELRAASAALVALADQPSPPPRAVLNAARWRIARMLLRHLPLKDRLVYARLRCHSDAKIAAVGARFSAEALHIYTLYEQHSERWTPEAVEADWARYRVGVRMQQQMLTDRLEREEAELLPLLNGAPEVPLARSPDDRNWAAAGWRFRELLEVGAGPRAEAG